MILQRLIQCQCTVNVNPPRSNMHAERECKGQPQSKYYLTLIIWCCTWILTSLMYVCTYLAVVCGKTDLMSWCRQGPVVIYSLQGAAKQNSVPNCLPTQSWLFYHISFPSWSHLHVRLLGHFIFYLNLIIVGFFPVVCIQWCKKWLQLSAQGLSISHYLHVVCNRYV